MKVIVGPVDGGAREPQSKRGRHRNMWPPLAPGATRTLATTDMQNRSRGAIAPEFCGP
jgi:hypothetical protein